MTSLQAIGLAALIYNERWQEVRQELQWSPDIFRSFRLRQGEQGEHVDTVFHLLCSKGAKCPLDLLEGVLNIAPELVQVDSESLLQSLLQNKMWEIILIILRCYPDVIRTTLFPTRQGYLVTILHVLCHRQAHGECPPLTVVEGVIAAAPESLQWKGPGIPLHYAVQSCCTQPIHSDRYKWLDLIYKLLEAYPEGVAVWTLATPAPAAQQPQQQQQQQPASNGCTPLSLAVSLSAYPDTVRRLLEACPEQLLSEAGVHESFLNVAYDSTLYAGRENHRSAVFDLLRPAHYAPAAALLSIVPVVVAVAAAVARPRFARTSLGAIMLFNVLHGPNRILDWWEQRGRRPIAARLEPIALVAITSPGLSLNFHNEQQAAHTLHPAITSPTYKTTTTTKVTMTENKKDDELASNTPDACVVCWEGMADHVLIPCGHVCLCLSCSKLLRTTLRSKCPVCNGIVQQALKIFGAGIATK